MSNGQTPNNPNSGSTPEPPPGAASRNLLQQELITFKARLDRQVSQLIRINEFSNHLLGELQERAMAQTFAEAIVDVLDIAVGAVWVLPPNDKLMDPSFAAFGVHVPHAHWEHAGSAIAEKIGASTKVSAVRLDANVSDILPGVPLITPIACRCVSRDGLTTAIVLAADTPAIAGMSEPVSDETLAMLAVLAEKCAAHIDHWIDRRLIEHQLAELSQSQEQLELVMKGANDGWWDWDMRDNRCFLSGRWLQLMGESDHAARTQDGFWTGHVHPQDAPGFALLLEHTFSGESTGVDAEVRLRRADGSWIPVLVRGTVLRDADGQAMRFAGSVQDLTERRRYEADIHQLAYFDPLTDLPNRRLLLDRLQQSLHIRERTGQLTAVLMLDVDRFKRLNDTHGHAAGDQLLRAISKRLRDLVRPYDTVSRLGGDEFVVLLEQLGSDPDNAIATAERTATKLLVALDEPYAIDVGVTHHSVSIGVAASINPTDTADTLLKAADVALYAAKDAGRNIVRVFRPEMQHKVDRRSALESRLREAFARSEVRMNYQAQVDRENDNLLYCESQYGGLRRYNLELGEGKEIRPAGTLGQPALRFNWNSPLALSPHDPKVLYYGSQYLHRSGNRGDTWVRISADMTRPGPYGTAQQNTLTAIAESPSQAGVLWTGADDGRVCVSRDAGRTWTDWSAQLPRLEGASVTCIEPSLGQAGTALVSFSRHRLEDHEPYLYRVSEFGANWQRLDGLPAEEPVHVVREDPANSSVLYAGTEAGVRISLDAGKSWAKLGKLPTVPVHDLVIQPVWRELVIATHGRGAYICDISAVGMMTGPALARDAWLYGPGRVEQGAIFGPNLLRTGQFFQGANLLPGAGFSVHFRKKPVDKARLVVRDAKALPLAELKLEQRAGFQTARWNLTALKSLTSGKGTLRVAPGQYSVVLLDGERELASASFQVHGKVPGGPVREDEEEDNTITPGDEMSRDNPGGEKP